MQNSETGIIIFIKTFYSFVVFLLFRFSASKQRVKERKEERLADLAMEECSC
jgi:hypothetical protein